MLLHLSVLRFSLGCDSSNLKDHTNTMTANNSGVRNTMRHDAMCKIAKPRKGANTGVERNTVKINDMMRAIASPTYLSRTLAMVVIKTADAPIPATNLATNIKPNVGA